LTIHGYLFGLTSVPPIILDVFFTPHLQPAIGVFAVAFDEAVIDVDAVDSVDDVADAAVDVDVVGIAVDVVGIAVDVVGIAVDEAVVDLNLPDVVIVEVFVAVEDVVTVPVEDADTELEEEVSSKEKLDFLKK